MAGSATSWRKFATLSLALSLDSDSYANDVSLGTTLRKYYDSLSNRYIDSLTFEDTHTMKRQIRYADLVYISSPLWHLAAGSLFENVKEKTYLWEGQKSSWRKEIKDFLERSKRQCLKFQISFFFICSGYDIYNLRKNKRESDAS